MFADRHLARVQEIMTAVCADFETEPVESDGENNHVHLLVNLPPKARQNTLTAAYHAHPEQLGHRPHPPVMPTQFWINQPEPEPQIN